MALVSSFSGLVQQLAFVITVPTFDAFVTVLTGWVFARRRTVTGIMLAADAVDTKHHLAFHRLFAKAEWCLDELGLAVLGLILPWVRDATGASCSDPLLVATGKWGDVTAIFGGGGQPDSSTSPRLS